MSDDVKFVITVIAGMLTGGFVQSWFNRRKTASDAYSVLVDALIKSSDAVIKSSDAVGDSGMTIKGMIDLLVELPQLKSQLKEAQDKISALEKQSIFWMSFSRNMRDGALANAEYIRKLDHIPPFEPPTKFPTGPISFGPIPTGGAAQ